MPKSDQVRKKLSKSYEESLKSDNKVVVGNAWQYYVESELKLDLRRRERGSWLETKAYFDVLLIDFVTGYLSKANFDYITSELLERTQYEPQFKLYYLMLCKPHSPIVNQYLEYEIKGVRLGPEDRSEPHPHWLIRIEAYIDKFVDKDQYSEHEFKQSCKDVFEAFYKGEFSYATLLSILENLTNRVKIQFYEFEDEELGQLLLFLEEAVYFNSIEYAEGYVDIKKILGIS